MRLSDIMFYVFIVFCSSSFFCSIGQQLNYKYTVSVRIVIHEGVCEALSSTLKVSIRIIIIIGLLLGLPARGRKLFAFSTLLARRLILLTF